MSETQRVVADGETTWTCVQAYAGMGEGAASEALAERREEEGRGVPVVCTPSGGAQSVRLELPADWGTVFSDEELLRQIATHRG